MFLLCGIHLGGGEHMRDGTFSEGWGSLKVETSRPRLCPLLPLAHPHLHERDDAGAEPLHRPRLRAQRRLRGRASNEPSRRFHNHASPTTMLVTSALTFQTLLSKTLC